jgi:SAM-dependent methyltransferase
LEERAIMDFRDYIRTKLIKKNDRILEFGPLIRPFVSKKNYPNAFFADVRSTAEIKSLYTSNDYLQATGLTVDIDSIVEIDYVITKSYTDTFKNEEKFDVVYLSHVIEHMPDIISFFKDVGNILNKSGKLILIYPDARYCFDHFRNGTTFVDAYDTYMNKKMNANAVFDFTYNVIHENTESFFWNNKDLSKKLPNNSFKKSLKALEDSRSNILPDDVHFWPFSDYQFVKFLYDMDKAGLLDFEISDFHETQYNTQEFMIVLTPKKGKSINKDKYEEIISNISPAVKAIKDREEKQVLIERITDLEKVVNETKNELRSVYNSKRWLLASKAAEAKQLVFKRKND